MVRKKFLYGIVLAAGVLGSILTNEAFTMSSRMRFINSDSLIKGMGNSVYDIDIGPDGRIYVPDFRNDNVLVLDKGLNEVLRIKVPSPHGLTVAADGSLYVATYKDGRIYKFDPLFKELKGWDRSLVKGKKISLPLAVDTDKQGNLLIADYALKTVIKVDSEGRYIGRFDTGKIGEGRDFLPHSVMTDGEEYVYVADRGKEKAVRVFKLDGGYVGAWHCPAGEFDPLAVRFLDHKLLLAPNYKDSKLHLFDLSGKWLTDLGSYGDKPGEFLHVTNLVSDGAGHIYVVEEEGNRIQEIDMSGFIETYRD
jgi:DNA-binding beta-propeller fold protein YncE